MAQNETLLVDGIKYCPWTPKNEAELENSLTHHAGDVFGPNCIYFDIKKKIKSATGESTIPDGYLVDFNEKTFHIVEVELSTHHEYDHIGKQIGRFIAALKDYRTRQRIARILKDYIEEDIVRQKFVRDKIGDTELYQFFLEDILESVKEQNYHTIVVIDKITEKIKEACSILAKRPKILKYKTFVRENIGDLRVHCHLFEPLVAEKIKTQPQVSIGKYITRHRDWGVKDDKNLYVKKITIKSGQEYRDSIPKEEFMKIVNTICSLGKKGVELTRRIITDHIYGKEPHDDKYYWWVDNTMGVLILGRYLEYIGGKAPQKFRPAENFVPEIIFKKIKS